jgi:hypothetical protein
MRVTHDSGTDRSSHRSLYAALLIGALVLYGNAKSFVDLVVLQNTAAGSTFGIGAGIALVLAILTIAVALRADLAGMGLAGGGVRSSLRLGVWVGGTAALTSGALIVVGALASRALGLRIADFTPAAAVPWGALLWRAVLLIWVDTVLPEELAFRGAVLLALDARPPGTPADARTSYPGAWVQVASAVRQPAVLVSSLAFAAWHIVVVIQDGVHDFFTFSTKLAVIAVGGVLFAGLRLSSRNLIAPAVGHWLFDLVAMIAARFAVAL